MVKWIWFLQLLPALTKNQTAYVGAGLVHVSLKHRPGRGTKKMDEKMTSHCDLLGLQTPVKGTWTSWTCYADICAMFNIQLVMFKTTWNNMKQLDKQDIQTKPWRGS